MGKCVVSDVSDRDDILLIRVINCYSTSYANMNEAIYRFSNNSNFILEGSNDCPWNVSVHLCNVLKSLP